jgi:indole-3-glycerol phosphate synthase
MNILKTIAHYKLTEVEANKALKPIKALEKSLYFERRPLSFTKALLDPEGYGIIAEFKRQSPSKGIINATARVEDTIKGYAAAGASVVSVLTDNNFFGGSNEDILAIRESCPCPILRKDFIVDEYQIVEAKAIGADVILLIAAILTPKQIEHLAAFAKKLELNVLLEVHDQEELERSPNDFIDVIGVNNRNLQDFTVDLQKSFELSSLIPEQFLKISESAITQAKTIHELRAAGYKGFLIGEKFMHDAQPERGLAQFIADIKNYRAQ